MCKNLNDLPTEILIIIFDKMCYNNCMSKYMVWKRPTNKNMINKNIEFSKTNKYFNVIYKNFIEKKYKYLFDYTKLLVK